MSSLTSVPGVGALRRGSEIGNLNFGHHRRAAGLEWFPVPGSEFRVVALIIMANLRLGLCLFDLHFAFSIFYFALFR